MKKEAFIYTWSTEDEESETKQAFHLRMYGMDEENKNICIHVRDFMPYFYIELEGVLENEMRQYQRGIERNILYLLHADHREDKCEKGGCKGCWKGKMSFVYGLKKLYFHHPHNSFCMIKMEFINNIQRKKTFYKLQEKKIQVGFRSEKTTLLVHENEANPILQFCTQQHIDTSGWIKWSKDLEAPTGMLKQTSCQREISKNHSCIKPLEDKDKPSPVPYILSFDIEVYSSVPTRMPDAEKKQDVVFQISMVFTRKQNQFKSYLLSLGNPIPSIVGKNVILKVYPHEKELLLGFTQILQQENPNVIIGYNIFGFDLMYMISRAKLWGIMSSFDQMGARIKDRIGRLVHSPEKTVTWSSSAYSHQNFMFLDTEGRLFVDLLPVVRRDYKFENYRLKTVSEYFIGETKDPIKPKDIFEGYRLSKIEKKELLLSKVGKYCVQDSRLVLLLFEKLQLWIGLTEMAKTCRVPVLTLYTQGQQIKVFSQLYYQCTHDNIVVQSPHSLGKQKSFIEGADHYSGAYVFPPDPGVYDWVVPFDFCLAGNTLVSLPNGTSKRIDSLTRDSMVLGFKDGGFRNFSSIHGLQVKGVRETVKIVLQDGQTLIATPEHKFMLENGEWCHAKDLKGKQIKCGIEGTEDVICSLEKDWFLAVDGYTFTMKEEKEREISLAFARILGYVMTNGHISIKNTKMSNGTIVKRQCIEAGFGTMIDAVVFKLDMMKLSGINVNICKHRFNTTMKETTFTIALPSVLANMIHSLNNIDVDKGYTQDMKIPSFLLEEHCPLSVAREFLGGLYGGGGVAPSYKKPDKTFGNIELKWIIIEKNLDNMKKVIGNLKTLHMRLGMDVFCSYIKKVHVIIPKEAYYDVLLTISMLDTLRFRENIGFRYSINQSCRLAIVASYQRMHMTIANDDKFQEQTLHQHDRMVSNNYITRMRFGNKEKPNEFIDMIGVKDWFDGDAVEPDDDMIPSYKMKVIEVCDNEPVEVFDIEVDDAHNFIANSACVSNCSLYPCSIIAHNIDFSTLVLDESVPDDLCNKIEWWDHIGCEHDTTVHAIKPKYQVCQKFSYRFLKAPLGVVPRALNALLSARSSTKKQMKEVGKNLQDPNLTGEEKKSLETLYNVYDKRQLAYKVSANSMYGAMGVKKGYLPFLPGAMCTTAMGRHSIQKAAAHVKKNYNGKIVYGDTDSIYCHFPLPPHPEFAKNLWEYAKQVENEILSLFPKPMKLAFEEKIYKKFMILTKKRYMALTCDHEGHDDTKLTIRGVLLARRDNARWVRSVYEKVVRSIMANMDYHDLLDYINQEILSLFRNYLSISLKQFIISKTLGKDYAIRELSTDVMKRNKRLKDLAIDPHKEGWEEEYKLKSQPAHAQLAMRMKNRGNVVEAGSRIEYVLIQHPEPNPKLFERIEDPSYVMEHSDLIKIDPIYYAQNLINPLDQAIEICFKKKKVVERIIQTHIHFKTLMMELVWHFHPFEFQSREGSDVYYHPVLQKFNKKKKNPKKKPEPKIIKNPKKKKVQVSIVEMMTDLLQKKKENK